MRRLLLAVLAIGLVAPAALGAVSFENVDLGLTPPAYAPLGTVGPVLVDLHAGRGPRTLRARPPVGRPGGATGLEGVDRGHPPSLCPRRARAGAAGP